MVANLPPLDEFLRKHLGSGARFQQALTFQDTYFLYMCQALEQLVRGSGGNDGGGSGGGGNGGSGGGATYPQIVGVTELIDPRLQNWQYYTNTFGQLTIASGKPYQFIKDAGIKEEYGQVLITSIRVSDPDVRLYVRPYSQNGQYLDLNNTPRELLATGRVTPPTGIGFDLIRYDDINEKYVMELRAPWPGIPFYGKVEIYLMNESSSDITVYDATISLIKLNK